MTKIILVIVTSGFVAGTFLNGAIAGHDYHSYGLKMTEMSEFDSNNDGGVTFKEFSAPTVDRLESGFNILDTDGDKKISGEEWDGFLKVHGFEK